MLVGGKSGGESRRHPAVVLFRYRDERRGGCEVVEIHLHLAEILPERAGLADEYVATVAVFHHRIAFGGIYESVGVSAYDEVDIARRFGDIDVGNSPIVIGVAEMREHNHIINAIGVLEDAGDTVEDSEGVVIAQPFAILGIDESDGVDIGGNKADISIAHAAHLAREGDIF